MSEVPTVHLVRGNAPAESTGITFDSDRLGEAVFAEQGVEIFRGESVGDAVPVFFVRKPATTRLPESAFLKVPSRCLIVSYQGFENSVWCDGPIIERREGMSHSYVAEGFPCVLTVGDQRGDFASVMPDPDFYAGVVNSLVTCARSLTLQGYRLQFPVSDFNLLEYVTWVLLAKAYPSTKFYPTYDKPYKSWPPIAKRICQHLGWSMYERAPQGEPIAGGVTLLRRAAQPCAAKLVPSLNTKSVIIPGKWD